MGFCDSLFGRRRPSSPEDVRQALFDAAAQGYGALLAELAAEHEAPCAASGVEGTSAATTSAALLAQRATATMVPAR
jgi:hypothetical protein